MQGEASVVNGELLRRFRSIHSKKSVGIASKRREVVDLQIARDMLAQENEREAAERKAKEKAKREKEQAAARTQYLNSLVGREDDTWKQVEASISAKNAKEYDRAINLIIDLHEVARRAGTTEAFALRLHQLRERHAAKRAFLQKLNKAGLAHSR